MRKYITLCKSNEQRVSNVDKVIQNHPSIKIFKALEHHKDWELVHYLFTHFNIPAEHHTAKKKGKMCRWATVLMAAKYIYDLKIKQTNMVFEDDVFLGPGFKFYGHKFRGENRWIKLSRWGEVFALNCVSAEEFIRRLYDIGINNNNDRWIKENLDHMFFEIRKPNSGSFDLVCKTNQGIIRKAETLHKDVIKSMCLKPGDNGLSFLETPLFYSVDDLDFAAVLERYKHDI